MSVRKTLPKFAKDALGQSRQECIAQNQEEIKRRYAVIEENEEIANNENERLEVRARAREKAEEERQNVAALKEGNENLREKLPLREGVKGKFKKYGFTVNAIVLAAEVTIGAVMAH